MEIWTWTNGGGWTSCSALLCPAGTFSFCKVLKNLVLVLLGLQGGDPDGLGATDALGKDASQGLRGGNSQLCSSWSQGKAQGFSSQRTLPLRLQPHAPCRQPASSLPSGQSCSWLQSLIAETQVPSPHWNSSPRQVPSAARRGQGARVRANMVLGQLSSPHPHSVAIPGKNRTCG